MRLGLAFRVQRRRRRLPHGERGRRLAVAQEVGVAACVAGFDIAKFDAWIDERGRVGLLRLECTLCAAVQRTDRCQQRWPRAEVLRQRRRAIGNLAGIQIGMHVAAAEPVDCLLWIADEEQRGVVAAAAEHVIEHRPLARVGVLEFVHQRNPVLRAQALRQGLAMRSRQRIGNAVDQVVVGVHAALLLELRQPHASVGADAMQQGGAALVVRCFHRAHGVQIGGDQAAQRRRRGSPNVRLVGP